MTASERRGLKFAGVATLAFAGTLLMLTLAERHELMITFHTIFAKPDEYSSDFKGVATNNPELDGRMLSPATSLSQTATI